MKPYRLLCAAVIYRALIDHDKKSVLFLKTDVEIWIKVCDFRMPRSKIDEMLQFVLENKQDRRFDPAESEIDNFAWMKHEKGLWWT